MKIIGKNWPLFFLIILPFISCGNKLNKCGLCFTPPPTFIFEMEGKASAENLYSSGFLEVNDIKIKNENNENVEFKFIKENSVNLIQLSEIGWETGKHSYSVYLSKEIYFNFELEMQENHSKCCTSFEVVTFDINQYEFEVSKETGVIKIKI